MNKTHIVLMAGGTGGHIFPGLAVAKACLSAGYSVSWLGTPHSMEARIIPTHGIEIDFIPIQNVRGKGLLRWALLPWRLLIAMCIARRVLKKRKAALVIGMGGFVAGPGALAARSLNLPLVIHEQNALAGMTNRYLARCAQAVLCGFPRAFKPSVKAIYVGNPVRQEFINLHAEKAMAAHQPLRVLVVGGSQGARIFNELIPQTLALLPQNSIEIWQQSGEKLYDQAQANFKTLVTSAKITPFIEDIARAYQWADLVICRAGALTVSELTAAKKPAIFIPLPNAADDHQRLNAEFLSTQGAGILILQKNCSPEKLSETLLDFINHPAQLASIANKAGSLAKLDATAAILKYCDQLLSKQI